MILNLLSGKQYTRVHKLTGVVGNPDYWYYLDTVDESYKVGSYIYDASTGKFVMVSGGSASDVYTSGVTVTDKSKESIGGQKTTQNKINEENKDYVLSYTGRAMNLRRNGTSLEYKLVNSRMGILSYSVVPHVVFEHIEQTLTSKTIDSDANDIKNIDFDDFKESLVDQVIDGTETAYTIPTAKAVKDAVWGSGHKLSYTSTSDYVYRINLHDKDNNVISFVDIDLPLELIKVVSLVYDNTSETFVMKWQGADGVEHRLEIPASGILKGVVTQTATQELKNKTIDARNNTISYLTGKDNFKVYDSSYFGQGWVVNDEGKWVMDNPRVKVDDETIEEDPANSYELRLKEEAVEEKHFAKCPTAYIGKTLVVGLDRKPRYSDYKRLIEVDYDSETNLKPDVLYYVKQEQRKGLYKKADNADKLVPVDESIVDLGTSKFYTFVNAKTNTIYHRSKYTEEPVYKKRMKIASGFEDKIEIREDGIYVIQTEVLHSWEDSAKHWEDQRIEMGFEDSSEGDLWFYGTDDHKPTALNCKAISHAPQYKYKLNDLVAAMGYTIKKDGIYDQAGALAYNWKSIMDDWMFNNYLEELLDGEEEPASGIAYVYGDTTKNPSVIYGNPKPYDITGLKPWGPQFVGNEWKIKLDGFDDYVDLNFEGGGGGSLDGNLVIDDTDYSLSTTKKTPSELWSIAREKMKKDGAYVNGKVLFSRVKFNAPKPTDTDHAWSVEVNIIDGAEGWGMMIAKGEKAIKWITVEANVPENAWKFAVDYYAENTTKTGYTKQSLWNYVKNNFVTGNVVYINNIKFTASESPTGSTDHEFSCEVYVAKGSSRYGCMKATYELGSFFCQVNGDAIGNWRGGYSAITFNNGTQKQEIKLDKDNVRLIQQIPCDGGYQTRFMQEATHDNKYDGRILYGFGSDWNCGAGFELYGKDCKWYDEQRPGWFYIIAHDGTNSAILGGKPSGSLSWKGYPVISPGNPDANGGGCTWTNYATNQGFETCYCAQLTSNRAIIQGKIKLPAGTYNAGGKYALTTLLGPLKYGSLLVTRVGCLSWCPVSGSTTMNYGMLSIGTNGQPHFTPFATFTISSTTNLFFEGLAFVE